jgi:carbonic anhydrase/acetyltransferase-like protein (isoleucine patch superfamily)
MLKVLLLEILMWLEALVRHMPGRAGVAARRSWFRHRFGGCDRVTMGAGCQFLSPQAMRLEGSVIIGPNAFFTADGGSISIGGTTSFNSNVHINASVGGAIRIGQQCLIGPNVVMRTAGHRFDDPRLPIRDQGHVVRDITIDDNVWIGAGAIILGGVHICEGAVIGAGAVVVRNVAAMAIAVGVPAKVIGSRKTVVAND